MKYALHLLVFTLLITPFAVFAQQPKYIPLVGLPGINGATLGTGSTFNDYINALYALSIGIAALLAVIKIIIAGVKWMLTDIVPTKEEAKKDIKGALLGLIIILSAVMILNVINPNLTTANINLKPAPGYSSGGNPSVTPSFNNGSVITLDGSNYKMTFLPEGATPEQQVMFKNSCENIDASQGKVQYNIPVLNGFRCISGGPKLALEPPRSSICLNEDCTHPQDPERLERSKELCETDQVGRNAGIFVQDRIYPGYVYCFFERL